MSETFFGIAVVEVGFMKLISTSGIMGMCVFIWFKKKVLVWFSFCLLNGRVHSHNMDYIDPHYKFKVTEVISMMQIFISHNFQGKP